ncbi:hypothetical protein A3A68_01565 [Candidatus Saccharibacteria bacterium RIFCSPLOWO2_01_FULL_48_13]|nr:MAG: hypothetical protein A3F38_00135 [Candidatus Saccharibacteria bacterium RIFCSPHIGHO2_12_FULL_48_21]OGL37436.1 MAG: hypothetical protein A3A68_01565 [Candidatus Saccharibacteria bacterium RIFCSPLOWO2_01_FULL_48_13]
MMLAFKPSLFFNELEKISRYKRSTLEKALRDAESRQLVEIDRQKKASIIRLTAKGKQTIKPFVAKRLPRGGQLMVIFDIPEDMAVGRAKLRRVLKEWDFKQAQKSVWITSYDHKQSVKDLVSELGLGNFVQLYECALI